MKPTQIEEIVNVYNLVKQETTLKLQEGMKKAFKEFFTEHPEIKGIRWTQYVPTFNDGEPCEFTMGEFSYLIDGIKSKYADEDNDTGVDEDGFIECFYIKDEDMKKYKYLDDFVNALIKIPDEVFEATFGSNSKITATSEGYQVDEYDCGY